LISLKDLFLSIFDKDLGGGGQRVAVSGLEGY
jgi:hypothetical protein